jgi:putative lipoprotein
MRGQDLECGLTTAFPAALGRAGQATRERWYSQRMYSALRMLVVVAAVTLAPAAYGQEADPWIARDKALHFDVSAGIAAAGYGVSAGWLVEARWKALALGGGMAIAAGAGKELLDATHVFGGDPSWKDFAWDVLGTIAGLALAWGMDLLLGGVGPQRPALAAP